jgi:hypothetical protein
MKKLSVFLISGLVITCFVTSCFLSDDEKEDSLPCMCFQNNSGTTAVSIRYRVAGSSSWTNIIFDDAVYGSGDGFDCAEGTFKAAVAAGTYDFEIRSSVDTIRGWSSVPYNGGNIGFLVTSSTGTSIYGAVDGNCQQAGLAYYADY